MIRLWLLMLASSTALAASSSGVGMAEAAILPTAFLALGLLCASALFSSSETALFGLQTVEIEALSGPRGATIRRLLDQPRETLASILIGNETVNAALSTVTASTLLSLFPDAPWLNVIVLAPVLLIFGEVLPKTFAFRFRTTLVHWVAPSIQQFSRWVSPIRVLLGRIADAALVLTGGSRAPRTAELREAHLRAMIDRGRETGTIHAVEQEILHNVFEFGEHTVDRLMTPRADVFALNLLMPWPELIQGVQKNGRSRIPVWQGSQDNIIGILVVKRLLRLIASERSQIDEQTGRSSYQPGPRQIQKLLHPARFVPTTKQADDLLEEFKQRRSHMAIVVNEIGGMVGVVTLDDLLSELIGEVHDETDREDPAVTPMGPTTYRVRADMALSDFVDRFHLNLSTDLSTLGDFVTALVEGPAEQGSQVEVQGLSLVIGEWSDGQPQSIVVDMGQLAEEDDPTVEAPVPMTGRDGE
jgi:putative hemolysin